MTLARQTGAALALLAVSACASVPDGLSSPTAAVGLPVLGNTFHAASSGRLGGLSSGLQRDLHVDQRRREEARRRAAAEARLPRPASARSTGPLTPVGEVASVVRGRTLVLQTPIVQNGAHLRTDVQPIYFAPDGQSHSPAWTNRPWSAQGASLCLGGQPQPDCMTVMEDATGQAFLRRANGLLVQVDAIRRGDSENVRQSFVQAQQDRRSAEERQAALVLGLLGLFAASGGGGGGGGSISSDREGRMMDASAAADARRQAEADANSAAAYQWQQRQYAPDPLNR